MSQRSGSGAPEEELSQQSGEQEENLEEVWDEFGEEYEEGEGEEAEGVDNQNMNSGIYNATDVNDQVLEELHLPEDIVSGVQSVWEGFMKTGSTRDEAGEALYSAVFDAAPSLQSLFKTPRAVMAMRFILGLNQIIMNLHDPPALKVVVETLGFQHLELEVTIPRVVIFRDAITDLLSVELGHLMNTRIVDGWKTVLNYVGGSYIYIRVKYTERLKILASSWATANNRMNDENGEEYENAQNQDAHADDHKEEPKKRSRFMNAFGGGGSNNDKEDSNQDKDGSGSREHELSDKINFRKNAVPTTYNEMFMFNAAVMGFGDKGWMSEVLISFDAIVRNVSNSTRLQEECDVLSLRMAKYKGTINLAEYKAVMLASLRSLVPKDWNSAHEISWSWLWENVERMIKANLGKPAVQEKSLAKLLTNWDEQTRGNVRRGIYATFFQLAPAGQDYFKQSTTRLHFIADRIVAMTLEIFRDSTKMVEDISAMGLRHVGYGIPTELFGPFVTACVKVVRTVSEDETTNEAFRWSLGLVSRILTRVINEGSTIVMKAINQNSAKLLRKAVACAPRGKRALWMLNIQVGTQSISPLLWAIEAGSLEAAKAIIVDLLTIRADRDRYYYGMDTMFERHPDIVKRLVQDAPALLYTIFDGLIWRSRTTENGVRRVNYYVKHLMVDSKGEFARTIEWLTENGDPKIVCHPVVAMVTDLIWGRVAFRAFLYGKAWEIFSLLMFIIGVAFFGNPARHDEAQRIVIMSCRLFTYLFSLCPRIFKHVKRTCQNYKQHQTITFHHIPLPTYLLKWQDIVCLFLTIALILMLVFEPILACLGQDGDYEGAGMFTQACDKGTDMRFTYSVMCVFAMFFYFLLTIDLSVFSTRVSAWVLIVFRVVNEVWLYVSGMSFVILAFSCAIAALKHNNEDFNTIPQAALSLLEVSLMIFDGSKYSRMDEEPAVLVIVVLYLLTAVTFLLNLLIAQMNCAYKCVYEDMLGYARLNRGKIVTESMTSVAKWRWSRFVDSLKLDEPCEFGEGDIGLSGAIQVVEPASQNITTVDMIRRFGGSTSPSAQWPEEEGADLETDRFSHIERMLEKAIRRMTPSKGKVAGGSSSSGQNVGSGGYDASGGSARSKDNASEAASEN
uniref:Globin domain-containing protein n=1 Tax=Alexandrium monilatum TaxID=311494 RepID=A0A7S4RSG3_9DINO